MRKRISYSCVECKRRKKVCEGGVPGCRNCVLRKTIHLCRYGDERDSFSKSCPPNTVSTGSKIPTLVQSEKLPGVNQRTNTEPLQTQTDSMQISLAEGAKLDCQGALGDHDEDNLPDSDCELTFRNEFANSEISEVSRLSILPHKRKRADIENGKNLTQESPRTTNSRVRRLSSRSILQLPGWHTKLKQDLDLLPLLWQAKELVILHRRYLCFGGLLLLDDDSIVANTYHSNNPSCTILEKENDVVQLGANIALILMICASSLSMLPTSITLPIISSTSIDEEKKDYLVAIWVRSALNILDSSNLYRNPRLEAVEALLLYEYNLVGISPNPKMIYRLDVAIRLAKLLGLDRLGSADEDQTLWNAADQPDNQHEHATATDASSQTVQERSTLSILSTLPLSRNTSADWASETFSRRDHRLRECGRSIWHLLIWRDWNAAAQAGGTYNIHSDSFTTKFPKMMIQYRRVHSLARCRHRSNAVEFDATEPWHYIAGASDCLRQFVDLCGSAAAQHRNISYEEILKLDRRLSKWIDERPSWIRPETGATRWRFGTRTCTASDTCPEYLSLVTEYFPRYVSTTEKCGSLLNLISSILWHKQFIIHRPFLSLSLSQPHLYGLAQQRTLHGSLLLIESCDQYMEEANATILLFRLQHAAIALISMLLLQGAMFPDSQIRDAAFSVSSAATAQESPKEGAVQTVNPLRIHKGLMFAIQLLKQHAKKIDRRIANPTFSGSEDDHNTHLFQGVGEALERLLSAAAKMDWQQRLARQSDQSSSSLGKSNEAAAVGHDSVAVNTSQFEPRESDNMQLSNLSRLVGQFPELSHTQDGVSAESIHLLDRDLSRLLDDMPVTQNINLEANISRQSRDNFCQTSCETEESNQFDFDAPTRPPWVPADLWEGIFDTLKNWNA